MEVFLRPSTSVTTLTFLRLSLEVVDVGAIVNLPLWRSSSSSWSRFSQLFLSNIFYCKLRNKGVQSEPKILCLFKPTGGSL